MKFIIMSYIFISILCGFDAWTNTGWFVGMAAVLSSILACWAGIGFRGSLLVGNKSQKKLVG